jgi:DNA-binding NarL/FixJ family response regulator
MQWTTGAKCASTSVLVGIRHAGLAEGVRGLLAHDFDPVVTAPDETALVSDATRLQSRLAVLDLDFGAGDGLGLLRRLRAGFPSLRMIVLTLNESPAVERMVLAAGADRLVLKTAVASGLVPTAHALLDERLLGSDTEES